MRERSGSQEPRETVIDKGRGGEEEGVKKRNREEARNSAGNEDGSK